MKNVVTLTVDGIFSTPGIGIPGVYSTDTNGGLFIGGHPNPKSLPGLGADIESFNGCIKDVVINGQPLEISQDITSGDITLINCQG